MKKSLLVLALSTFFLVGCGDTVEPQGVSTGETSEVIVNNEVESFDFVEKSEGFYFEYVQGGQTKQVLITENDVQNIVLDSGLMEYEELSGSFWEARSFNVEAFIDSLTTPQE